MVQKFPQVLTKDHYKCLWPILEMLKTVLSNKSAHGKSKEKNPDCLKSKALRVKQHAKACIIEAHCSHLRCEFSKEMGIKFDDLVKAGASANFLSMLKADMAEYGGDLDDNLDSNSDSNSDSLDNSSKEKPAKKVDDKDEDDNKDDEDKDDEDEPQWGRQPEPDSVDNIDIDVLFAKINHRFFLSLNHSCISPLLPELKESANTLLKRKAKCQGGKPAKKAKMTSEDE